METDTKQKQIQFITDECVKANTSIKQSTSHYFKGNNLRCNVCGCTTQESIDEPNCIEFKVREIRLADVLLAIGKDESDLPVNYGATIPKWKIIHSDITGSASGWNLLKDSLSDQSGETIQFIYTLLK